MDVPPAFISFEKLMKATIKVVNPKKIVEWGPGFSTDIFLTSGAEIFSWENSGSWFAFYDKKFKDNENVHIYFGDTAQGMGRKTPYINAPLQMFELGSIDICFVDGRFRADCFLMAKHLISDNGVVMLHDIYRSPLEPLRNNYYQFRFEDKENKTGVYTKNQDIINKIKKAYEEI